MATIEKTQLRLEFDDGMRNGKQVFKVRTYSNIKNDATDVSLKSASDAIDALSQKDIVNTKKVVTSLITE